MNDIEYAKAVAHRMFELYDSNRNSNLEGEEVGPIMQDVYKAMNKLFNPTQLDINTYCSVLDTNHDGRVSLTDLEDLCIRYLAGESALAHSKTAAYKTYQETIKKTAYPTFLDVSPIKNESPLSVTVPSPNPYSQTLKRSTYTSTLEKNLRNSGVGPIERSNTIYAKTTPVDVLLTKTTPIERTSTVITKTAPLAGVTSIKVGGKEGNAPFDQIKRVFDKFDTDKNGLIDQTELKFLMEETYRHLGINRNVTSNDIQSYLRYADQNKDGFVSYSEYESIVIKALARHNIVFAY